MSFSHSAFNKVDDLVAKTILGSDGAASWQDFRKTQISRSKASAGAAPHIPLKRSDRLGTGLSSIEDERRREEEVRRDAGDAPLGSGYTEFKRRGDDAEEAAKRKRARLVLERVRPDGVKYFIKAEAFEGWKEDYVFTTRDRGTGYYWDGMDSAKKQMGLNDDDHCGDKGDGADKKDKEVKKKRKKKKVRETDPVDAVAPCVELSGKSPMEQVAAAMYRIQEARGRPLAGYKHSLSDGSHGSAQLLASAGWESAIDPSTQQTYYFHRGKGERRWEFPLGTRNDSTDLNIPSAPAGTSGKEGGSHSKVVVSKEMVENALPDGWTTVTDKGTGRTYYYHSGSGKTSWEKPTA